MTDRTYFALLFRLGGRLGWLLWFSNEVDGLDVANGKFVEFASLSALNEAAKLRGIAIKVEEPNLHDLDAIGLWLTRPGAGSVDAHAFLGAWNLFSDVASSLGLALDDRKGSVQELYDKLFYWGGPAWVTQRPTGDKAEWTPEEIALLADLLGRGLEMFSTRLLRA